MQETLVWSLGQEDTLEEEMATLSSIFALMDTEAWQATVHGVTKGQTRLSNWAHIYTEQDM